MAITFQENTTGIVSVMRGKCVSMLISWRYDHTGRGKNWRLTATNINQKFQSVDDAKTAANKMLAK
jgi:hypothetical protein